MIQDLNWHYSPHYLKDAIFWMRTLGSKGCWVRGRDLNLIKDGEEVYYTPAIPSGGCKVLIREAYPYEDWMEKYIGTNENLRDEIIIRQIKSGLEFFRNKEGFPPSMEGSYRQDWLPWFDRMLTKAV